MSGDISQEQDHQFMNRERRRVMTKAGLRLAETLWGIERFGKTSVHEPAPLHINMAWQLQTDPELRAALRAALDAVEVDG